jgi:hypothetical protein
MHIFSKIVSRDSLQNGTNITPFKTTFEKYLKSNYGAFLRNYLKYVHAYCMNINLGMCIIKACASSQACVKMALFTQGKKKIEMVNTDF